MLWYILSYVGGIATGTTLLLLHLRQVDVAVKKVRQEMTQEVRRLREDNYRLRSESDSIQRSNDCADAYRRGFQKGRADPMTQAERFAKNFEGRKVQFAEVRKT